MGEKSRTCEPVKQRKLPLNSPTTATATTQVCSAASLVAPLPVLVCYPPRFLHHEVIRDTTLLPQSSVLVGWSSKILWFHSIQSSQQVAAKQRSSEAESRSFKTSWCPHLDLEVLLSQPAWALELAAVGMLMVLRVCFGVARWVYICFLRPAKPLRRRYGSWAVVTGASDGIGRAFAFRLAASGLSLVLVGRNPDKLRDVAATVRSRSPRVEVVVDFAAPDLAEEGVRSLERAVAGLDVGLLVNSAGVSYPYARYFHEVDDDLLRTLVKVNVEGVTRVTQALLPAMLERKRGAIVNIGSGAAIVIPSDPVMRRG